MATRAELLKRGYSEVYAVDIEGIPYLFAERIPDRVDSSSAATLATNYISVVDALVFEQGDSFSIEADRKTGVARGKALDIRLSYEAMQDAGSIAAVLFKRPGKIAELTADLAYDGTTLTVDDSSAFATDELIYVGRELMKITSVPDATSIAVTRGLCGNVYSFNKLSPTYAQINDVPRCWRGRFVTLRAIMVAPDGKMLSSTWMTGTHTRIIWRGYISEQPVAGKTTINLRALPLCRLPAQDIGHDIKAALFNWDETPESIANIPVLITPTSGVVFHFEHSGGGASNTIESYLLTSASDAVRYLGTVCGSFSDSLAVEVDTAIGVGIGKNQVTGEILVIESGSAIYRLKILLDWDTYSTGQENYIDVPGTGPYFFKSGRYYGKFTGVGQYGHWQCDIPIDLSFEVGSWLPVVQNEGDSWQDLTIPSTGFGLIESDATVEIIEWSDRIIAATSSAGSVELGAVIMLQIKHRGMNATGRADLKTATEMSFLSGKAGDFKTVALTILESSGTGERGTFDTLALAQGYGIPSGSINESSFGSIWQNLLIQGVSDGRATLEDLAGGYLVLNRKCMVQRLTTAGDTELACVDVSPAMSVGTGIEISTDKAMLEGVEIPSPTPGPNEVVIDTSGIEEGAKVIVQALPRIQAEGPNGWSIKAPSIPHDIATMLAVNVIAYSDGTSLAKIPVAPWVVDGIQPGDVVNVTIRHPGIYDWTTAALGVPSLIGRVMGYELDLFSGVQNVVVMVGAGGSSPARFLCPSATVQSVGGGSSDELTLATGEGEYFDDGDFIILYDVGKASDGDIATVRIGTVSGDVLTLAASAPAFVGADTRVTYPASGSASSVQDDFMYRNTGYRWS